MWPGAQVGTRGGDVRVPRKGDKDHHRGAAKRNIEAAAPFYINGELVRLELQLPPFYRLAPFAAAISRARLASCPVAAGFTPRMTVP
jgi:hypothetical protein